MAKKGYKFRIYPTEEQKKLIRQFINASDKVYNRSLDWYKEQVRAAKEKGEERKIWFNTYGAVNYINSIKKNPDPGDEHPLTWLKDVDSRIINTATENLKASCEKLWSNRFELPKDRQKDFPVYKRVCEGISYTTTGNCYNGADGKKDSIRVEEGKYVVLPKIGRIKAVIHREIPGPITRATVIRMPSGKYYVSLSVTLPDDMYPLPNAGGEVGIDVGISHFYTDNHGNTVDNPKFYKKSLRKLKREQRKLSRIEKSHIIGYKDKNGRISAVQDAQHNIPIYDKPLKDCKNHSKQKLRVARINERVANQRKHFQDVESHKLACANKLVVAEDLKIKEMMQDDSKKLAGKIGDAGWYSFLLKVEYKMRDHGGTLMCVPTYFPSSQLCSNCGYKNTEVKNLDVRVWDCPECGKQHINRDLNAAINIFNKGKEMLEEEKKAEKEKASDKKKKASKSVSIKADSTKTSTVIVVPGTSVKTKKTGKRKK